MNFDDVKDVVKLHKDNKGYSRDQTRQAKEAIDFVTKRDGQWELEVIKTFKGRPKYTDDRTNPIVNQIVGEVQGADFTGRVRPAGGSATKETASVLDGLIRTIRNKSKFDRIKNQAGKRVAVAGISGWEIVKDYAEPYSFDMDLMIKPIHDYHSRVTLDPEAMSEDGGDGKWGVIEHFIGKEAFKEEFPGKNICSLGQDDYSSSYYNKKENVTIGQLYYLVPIKTTIARMSDGAVYIYNEQLEAALDELAEQGITIEATREVDDWECKQRYFSLEEWLTEEEDVDFNFVPIVPCYGNFEVVEGKIIYSGAVERLMDIQRVHNYAFSRNVEEVALSPRSKWFMTPEQAAGYTEELATLNTNMEPVQLYNHIEDQPPPFWSDTSGQHMAIANLITMTDEGINKASGIFAANIGDNPGLQSGRAIEQQIDRGNNGTAWVFEALEVAIERTLELLIRAIPKVYDGTREVVLTQDDGSLETMVINKPILDDESGEEIYLYDLTQGQYEVTIDIGAGFKNRQAEAVQAFERIAQVYPPLLEIASDIHLDNIEAPNFDKVAERARELMIQAGTIPESQLTDDEKAAIQKAREEAAQQPQEPSPEMIQLGIAQTQAQTALLDQENRRDENQLKMKEMEIKFHGQQEKTKSDLAVASAKINQEQQKIDQKALELELKNMVEMGKISNEQAKYVGDLALRLAELEVNSGQQLDAEVKSNRLVFNPKSGKIE